METTRFHGSRVLVGGIVGRERSAGRFAKSEALVLVGQGQDYDDIPVVQKAARTQASSSNTGTPTRTLMIPMTKP